MLNTVKRTPEDAALNTLFFKRNLGDYDTYGVSDQQVRDNYAQNLPNAPAGSADAGLALNRIAKEIVGGGEQALVNKLNATGSAFAQNGGTAQRNANGTVLNQFGQPIDSEGNADPGVTQPVNPQLAAYALSLMNKGYANGGKFTTKGPALVMGMDGKLEAVVGEGIDKEGKYIPETLTVSPHKDRSYGIGLSIPGVPGFAPPIGSGTGTVTPAFASQYGGPVVRDPYQQQSFQAIQAAEQTRAQQQSIEAEMQRLGLTSNGMTGQAGTVYGSAGYGGSGSTSAEDSEAKARAEASRKRADATDKAQRAQLEVEQQIFEASKDPVDLINVARIRRQHEVNNYKYGLAGLPDPTALRLPGGQSNLPPGMYAEPLTLAEYLTQFVLPEKRIAVGKAASAPLGGGGGGSSGNVDLQGIFGGLFR
jgi:hypothetical protein